MNRCRILIAASLALAAAIPVIAQPCEKEWWVASNGLQPLGGVVAPLCMTEYDPDGPGPLPNHLYVGGFFRFEEPTGISAGIARWDGITWTGVQNGLGNSGVDRVIDLVSFDPDGEGPANSMLVAGGAFFSAGGIPVRGLAAWNGSTWSDLGSGVDTFVFALAVHDFDGPGPQPPRLIVGGRFGQAGTIPAASIAMWDGAAWSALGGIPQTPQGYGENVQTLVSVDLDGAGPQLPQLFANMDHIRRWDGTQWVSTDRSGLNSQDIFEFADVDGSGPIPPRLYSINSQNVAYWEDGAWVVLPGSPGGNTLISWDENDTGERHLFAVAEREIHRYDGTSWIQFSHPSDLLIHGSFLACLAFDPDGPGPLSESIFIGGESYLSQPSPYGGIGRYGCAIDWARCFADANQDSRVSMPDLTAVLRDWGTGNPITDVNQDRVVGSIDLTAILHTWGEDCLPEETSQRPVRIDRSAISDPQFLDLLDAKDAGDFERINKLLANWDHGSQP